MADALLKVFQPGSESASWSTWVVDCMAFLGGAFRIYPQSHLQACFLGLPSEQLKLAWRIEYDMVADAADFIEVFRTECR